MLTRAFAAIVAAWLATFGALAPARAQEADPYAPAQEITRLMDAISTPNGVQELRTVQLGGMEQWISIRGADRRNPVLLYVHGGPGAPEMSHAWAYQRAWEDYFTVVNWDQRGAGRTLRTTGAEASRPTLSRARMTEDAVELIAFLREYLGRDRIVVLGHSWGNVVGLGAALERPQWVAAYVGVGPLLNAMENERVGYERVLQIARERGDAEAVAELSALAPYPGALTFDRIQAQRKYVVRYGGLAAYRDNADNYFRSARLSPVYDLADRRAIDQGGEMSVSTLIDELLAVDFSSVRRADFPVIMFVGRHDLTTPPEITEHWLDALRAPSKRLVWFEHSAHLSPYEEPGRTLTALVEHVRPLALRRQGRR